MDALIRTESLIGKEALVKLQNAHIAVIGLGGVGGYALEALARAGVGRLTLIDGDTVAESNLNRQILATVETVGMPKAMVAKARVAQIAPQAEIYAKAEFLNEQTAESLLGDAFDFIIDCIDDVPAKLLLAGHCREHKIPLLICCGTGNRLSSEGLRIANFDKTAGCPLAKKLRVLLKERQFSKLKLLFSDAPTAKVEPIEDGGKRTVGSISYVPAIAGLKLAEAALTAMIVGEENKYIPK
ncbi:MAG: tRNA threonylcarbamoyladenosine dehydratase [Clostridia bacterium]|nr:tRNA threonylcarbamoyladenosine dehydratase [Clostridia bacterium]